MSWLIIFFNLIHKKINEKSNKSILVKVNENGWRDDIGWWRRGCEFSSIYRMQFVVLMLIRLEECFMVTIVRCKLQRVAN